MEMKEFLHSFRRKNGNDQENRNFSLNLNEYRQFITRSG